MKVSKQIIELYELLLQQSQRLLESARCGDWQNLAEEKFRGLIDLEKLQRLEAQAVLDPNERERKAELLEQILELDSQTRLCLLSRQEELGKLISLSRRQRDMSRAYGQGGTAPAGVAKQANKGIP